MGIRNLLHKNKLSEFMDWLENNDIPFREGKGTWQVMQVLTKDHGWQCIFDRLGAIEHYTINEKLWPVVQQFLTWRKKGKNET